MGAVGEGEEAVPGVRVLGETDLRAELDRPCGGVDHLEEADRHPDGEDVAARGDVVIDLVEQLRFLHRMRGGGEVKDTWPEHRCADASARAGWVLHITGRSEGCGESLVRIVARARHDIFRPLVIERLEPVSKGCSGVAWVGRIK